MTKLTRLLLALLVIGLVVPGAALGKGASEATITGPGIGDGITLGEGQQGGVYLMQLADHAGFFPAVFQTSPDPMLRERPAGELGPRYTIEYTLPGPNNELDVVHQELYPYAEPEPVTYTEPSQAYWTDQHTVGGWYVADSILLDDLVAVGLPETAPTGSPGALPWAPVAGIVLVLGVGVLAAFAVHSRRRARPATA
jgi:hypothetical protein